MNILPVATLSRQTIADGDLLNQQVVSALSGNDEIFANALFSMSGNVYYHDPVTNSIYHYKDNDPDGEKVYSFSATNISANNLYSVNVSATNVSAKNTTTTNVTANNVTAVNTNTTNLSAVSENVYVISAAGTDPEKLVDIIQNLIDNWSAVSSYITQNQMYWSSLSAISATGMTAPFTGNTFKLSAGNNVSFYMPAADTVRIDSLGEPSIYVSNKRIVGQDEVYTLVIE